MLFSRAPAIAGSLLLATTVLAQPSYTVEDLGLLPLTDEAQVNGMNATGTIVGGISKLVPGRSFAVVQTGETATRHRYCGLHGWPAVGAFG